MTIEDFITKAKKVHGDKYDYSITKMGKTTKDKVCIICPEHGEFWQQPFNHLHGQNCPICGKIKRNKMYDKDEFIKRAKEIHGNKYDYSKVEFINTRTKVCIIYPGHGEFWQTPASHLSGHGWKYNPEENANDFIIKAKEVHGDKYDYSKVEYINKDTKVCIICPEHGEFWQSPYNHLKGQGCPKCGGTKRLNVEEFITRAKQIHGDKYDYSKVEYKNGAAKVCIICPEHGEFYQTPQKHLLRRGCPKCANKHRNDNRKLTTETFIEKAKQIHGDKYDYSKVVYKSYEEYVTIGCPIHGYFEQSPDSHLHCGGCPKCGVTLSKSEDEIYEYICSLVGRENVKQRVRKIIGNKEIDIFIPSLMIGFEYNGLYWHSTRNERMTKEYHLEKTTKCNENGIKLYQIFEDEYVLHKEIVLSKIKHLLKCNTNPKIMARKCEIKEITSEESKQFLNKNHIQGFVRSTVYVGAFYGGALIGVMSFLKERKNLNNWELNRFATDINYNVIGVGGKLLSYFIRKYNPEEIKSFADRRWTQNEENNVYIKIGFKKEKYISPEYRYYNEDIDKYNRIHKFNFRKKILNKKYGLDINMTEEKMADTLNYAKIYDCGLIKYVWKKEN